MKTGFVSSAEVGRPKKISETLMPPYLEEDQSRSYFFCSLQTTPFLRAGLVTMTYAVAGRYEADREGAHGPRQYSDSYNSSLSEDSLKSWKLNGNRNISITQLNLFPRFCVGSCKKDTLWELLS